MAPINSFVELPSGDGRRHPTNVECGWRVVTADGETYLLLETYGSSDRKIPGKVSQSIQLDRQGAAALKSLLERAFPGI